MLKGAESEAKTCPPPDTNTSLSGQFSALMREELKAKRKFRRGLERRAFRSTECCF